MLTIFVPCSDSEYSRGWNFLKFYFLEESVLKTNCKNKNVEKILDTRAGIRVGYPKSIDLRHYLKCFACLVWNYVSHQRKAIRKVFVCQSIDTNTAESIKRNTINHTRILGCFTKKSFLQSAVVRLSPQWLRVRWSWPSRVSQILQWSKVKGIVTVIFNFGTKQVVIHLIGRPIIPNWWGHPWALYHWWQWWFGVGRGISSIKYFQNRLRPYSACGLVSSGDFFEGERALELHPTEEFSQPPADRKW